MKYVKRRIDITHKCLRGPLTKLAEILCTQEIGRRVSTLRLYGKYRRKEHAENSKVNQIWG